MKYYCWHVTSRGFDNSTVYRDGGPYKEKKNAQDTLDKVCKELRERNSAVVKAEITKYKSEEDILTNEDIKNAKNG